MNAPAAIIEIGLVCHKKWGCEGAREGSSSFLFGEAVHGALDGGGAPGEDVGVDHRCADVLVAEKLLDGADVVPVFEEMSREAVAEGVAAGGLVEACLEHGAADGPLEHGFVEMVSADLAQLGQVIGPRGG